MFFKKCLIFGIIAGVSTFFMASGLIAGEESLVKWSEDAEGMAKELSGKIKYEQLDGKLAGVVDNKKNIVTTRLIPVEAGKKYILSGTFKSLGEAPSKVFFGFICYDKNKRQIHPLHSNIILDSVTSLASASKKGDKTLVLKANDKWKKGGYAVAFNVKDDFSDLPNREIVYKIIKVVPKGADMELQLSAPVKKAYPAGTKVRMHTGSCGRYLYTVICGSKIPKEWKVYEGNVTLAEPGQIGWKYFRPGTAFVRILIMPNYQKKKDEKIAFKDLSLKESN